MTFLGFKLATQNSECLRIIDYSKNMLLPGLVKYLDSSKKNLTSYDLFAFTVVIMIWGHVAYYLIPDDNIYRIPDRIMIPVFLISVGYNTGRRFNISLLIGAIILTGMNWLLSGQFYVNILGTFIIVRAIINPIMDFSSKSKKAFWVTYFFLILLIPITELYVEYGTMAVIMAMAGWINKNRCEVSDLIIKPSTFFMYTYITFLIYTQFVFNLPLSELFIMSIGTALIFYMLYDFKALLLNSIRRRPKDIIEKFCSFLGHKSLEIYVVHVIVFQVVLAIVLMC